MKDEKEKTGKKDNPLMLAVVRKIPFGKEHAVTRKYLSEVTQLSDRALRRFISDARKKGYQIINDQDGRGYYRTKDLALLEKFYYQERSRHMEGLEALEKIRQKLIKAGRIDG